MTLTNEASTARNGRGQRLIPHVIDDMAERDGEREAFQVPVSLDAKDGWRPVSFATYANAINHVAGRIVQTCGVPQPKSFPTIAFIGPNDVHYVILMVAAIKAGYKEGNMSLLDKTKCEKICFTPSYASLVQPWLLSRAMRAVQLGSADAWLASKEAAHMPYDKTWEEGRWEPLVVLHTSGSTGLPKPIVVRQGMLAAGEALIDMADWQGSRPLMREWRLRCKRVFIPMPLYHAAGCYFFFLNSVYYELPVALGLSDRPLSAHSVTECLQQLPQVDGALLPPAILEEMSGSEESVAVLKRLEVTAFAGGTLPQRAGDGLTQSGVTLLNVIAATECAPWPLYFQSKPELWQYFVFNSDLFGADWRRVEDEGVSELVIIRKDGQDPGLQGFFYTFPHLQEYSTKDLYKPHPSLPNNWIYCGRSDDVIVFSNGEKLNPVTMEKMMLDHDEIKAALVVGSGRFQPALIIEPYSHPAKEDEAQQLIERVWPLLETANKETVAHGRITREYVALSKPDKPFHRAAKGTVQRNSTVRLYEHEIDALYDKAGHVSAAEAPHMDVGSEEALARSIVNLFHTRLGAAALDPDADFFAAGVESMQIIKAARLLQAGLAAAGFEVNGSAVAPRVVYANPTPRRLAQYILGTIVSGGGDADEWRERLEREAMAGLYNKYTQDLVTAKVGRRDAADTDQTVLLTGSTGMLGCYLLDTLLKTDAVKKVVCLNRAEDGGVKQQHKAMADRGLTLDFGLAEFLHVDMALPDWGLAAQVYARLADEADRFIHNAWPVNFNLATETFEGHVRGTRHVADFAARAEKRVAVVFISSIATVDRWAASDGPVPEERLDDVALPSNGYGRSKLVGSLLLQDASVSGDFPAAVIRVGQIAGPESRAGTGIWNRHEWLPSIIASSLYLGALPSDLGRMSRVDWTPVERIARLVLDVVGATRPRRPADIAGYFHGVNPAATTWSALAPAVCDLYGHDRIRNLVSFRAWVDRLEASRATTTTDEAVERNPGLKLLDAYHDMAAGCAAPVEFATARAMAVSAAMRTAEAIRPELMRHWCAQWRL